MNKVAALQRKKRKDFIPYFLGFVLFLYCSVHLVSFAAKSAEGSHSARVRRALGKTWSVCVCVCVFVCGLLNLMKVLSRFCFVIIIWFLRVIMNAMAHCGVGPVCTRLMLMPDGRESPWNCHEQFKLSPATRCLFLQGFTDFVSDVVCVCVCVCVCQRMRQSASLHSPQSFLVVSSRCRRGRMEGSSFILWSSSTCCWLCP